MNEKEKCPCGSGLEYSNCCGRFHKGAHPENALQLMRSRYSAYVLNLPDYIVATTHPASPHFSENKFSWKRSISRFAQESIFSKLDVLDFKEAGSSAVVCFTAHLTKDSQDNTFTEKSYFEKFKDKWLYRRGIIVSGHAPNLVTTDQLRLLPLAYYGDPILRRKADPIPEITEDIKKLVEEMIETMDGADGIGLAAPQVHHSIRLFITRTPIKTEVEGKYHWGEVKVFINPVLSLPGTETNVLPESCLSIPTVRSPVERPLEMTVEYTTLDGTRKTERFTGYEARMVMHENDHINGILYIDRVDAKEKARLKPILQNLKDRIHDGNKL